MISPLPDFEDDLALLIDAGRAAGALLAAHFGARVKTWSKGAAGPVTEVDLAADALLKAHLRGARPDYGWLSEETADTPDRLQAERLFIVDPLDGTKSFIEGKPDFCVSLAVAERGVVTAGVVYNPIHDEMFAARRGGGTTLNGAPTRVTDRTALPGSRLIGSSAFYRDPRWPQPWPEVEATNVHAMAYRLALVSAGAHDGLVALGFKNDWDVAAGALLVQEAGGCVSDPFGAPYQFNQPQPRQAGAVASGAALHPLLIERVRRTPHPATFERAAAAARAAAADSEGEDNA